MPRHVPSSFQTLMNLYQNCMHVARCGCSTHPKLRVIGYGRRQRADVHQQNLALPCSQSKIWAFCLVAASVRAISACLAAFDCK